MNHVLIIHNNSNHYNDLQQGLAHSGFLATPSTSFEDAENLYKTVAFDIILVIENYLNETKLQNTQLFSCPIIALDESPTHLTHAQVKEIGAQAYFQLPVVMDTLLETIILLLEQKHQKANKQQKNKAKHAIDGIVGNSPPMKQLFNEVKQIAHTDVTVLIRGESGSGKELIAKAIHELSSRNKEALISINCAAIPESLIESELFGHEKGAFTGATAARDGLIAAADRGTLFLDEIGELPLEAQARLLRFLQEGEIRKIGSVKASTVDVRILTATHRDLRKMVYQGLFREDLYYRLYVMELVLPPLRERGEDISLIAQHLTQQMCEKHKKQHLKYTKEFNQLILKHNWPGNVRELENAIERAVILSSGNSLDPAALKLQSSYTEPKENKLTSDTDQIPMQGTTLDDYLIYFVLNNQNKMTETQIAQNLGISRKSLWERRQKLDILRKSNI